MNTAKRTYKYIEWLSADEMHAASLLWFSELNFIRDEQEFLNNLIQSYTIQLVDKNIFQKSKTIIDRLLKKERELVILMKQVQAHENQLGIMVDKVDQFKMEKAYIETHKDLTIAINRFTHRYRNLKQQLFFLISKIMKNEKRKRLLN
ncbi:MAG: hypothetical protein AAFO99_14850 [Bacteroidota bacterium]